MLNKFIEDQKRICAKYDASFLGVDDRQKVGISLNVKSITWPINGLRHPPEGDTTGWYIWAGEDFPNDPEFFVPLHVAHMPEWCPSVLKYLGLPPGWRFLIDEKNGYEDVWEDLSLLNI